MRFFTLLLDPEGRGISDDVRRSYEALPRRRGLEFAWQPFEQAAVLTAWDDPYGDPLVIQDANYLAVGMVRLDNREDLERWGECRGENLSDLGLALRVVARGGARHVPEILGDFTFVVWDTIARTGVAATDAFAARPLYYADRRGLLAWSSRAEPLATGEEYEPRYLIELLTSYAPPPGLSVYAGVRMVPPASLGRLEGSRVLVETYWSPADLELEPAWAAREEEAVDVCRRLLMESTRLRMGGGGEIWAQLSGGLDSSSVVSLAGRLAERGEVSSGLAGTVTYVDREGTQTDEREYSDAVTSRFGIPNIPIVDPPMWYDDEYPPVAPDQPGLDFHVQPRELHLCRAVRDAGGRVLLTGYGGDEVFGSSLLFLADLIARGEVVSAVRQLVHLAAVERVSMWDLAWRNVLVPLLPGPARRRLTRDDSPPGAWLDQQAVRRFGSDHAAGLASYGSVGRKHQYAIAHGVQGLQGVVHGGILSDVMELRHPLLYRPLVEFALTLPPEIRANPDARRWILRQAMRGILPERVRTRVGKPDTSDVIVGSLDRSRAQLGGLVKHSILADIGLIDRQQLRRAFERSSVPGPSMLAHHLALFPTLAVEAWLQIRSGRWPLEGHLGCNSRTGTVDSAGGVEGVLHAQKVGTAGQPAPFAG